MVYSVVALLPNLGCGQGSDTDGNPAAREPRRRPECAVSNPDTLESILKNVERPGSKHLPYFEVLLESQLVDEGESSPRESGGQPRIYEQAFEAGRDRIFRRKRYPQRSFTLK